MCGNLAGNGTFILKKDIAWKFIFTDCYSYPSCHLTFIINVIGLHGSKKTAIILPKLHDNEFQCLGISCILKAIIDSHTSPECYYEPETCRGRYAYITMTRKSCNTCIGQKFDIFDINYCTLKQSLPRHTNHYNSVLGLLIFSIFVRKGYLKTRIKIKRWGLKHLLFVF